MSLRIAVTGADGFVGKHFVDLAAREGHEVVAVTRSPLPAGHSLASSITGNVVGDLVSSWPDPGSVDVILHLAGRAAVGESFENPVGYLADNSAMLAHIGEDLLRRPEGTRPRLVVVSTGAVYSPSVRPLTEDAPLGVSSPYVVSKRAVEMLVQYYSERGVDGVIVRPFNHIGPGQRPGYIVPDLYAKLQALAPGQPLPVGNLESRRDYTDVRDVVRAYLALCTADSLDAPVYNVSRGRTLSGHEILASLCLSLDRPLPRVVTNQGALRPSDMSAVVGDSSRLKEELGWAPLVPIAQSIDDFVRGQEADS